MKKSELIIGSIYNSVKWKQPVKLELSDLVELYHRCDGAELDSEIIAQMFEPIELTEEWLIKFGFMKHVFNSYIEYKRKEVYFHIHKYPITNSFFFSSDEVHICGEEIKYVHQLQSLYFELKGEELNHV